MARNTATKSAAPAETVSPETAAPETSALSFEDADVPAIAATRAAAPNPFHDVVKQLADSRDEKGVSTKAKIVHVAKTDAEKMIRLLQHAGKAHDVTVRSTKADAGDKVKVTFWAVNKITRPRKDRETAAEPNEQAAGWSNGETAAETPAE
jgi:hypothetical protein